MDRLFHIALAEDWEHAQAAGLYRVSTFGMTLETVGFIHLCFSHQVRQVADRFYRDRTDLILLELDRSTLTDPVRVEAVAGTDERFPHLYGPISVDAVLAVEPFGPFPSDQS